MSKEPEEMVQRKTITRVVDAVLAVAILATVWHVAQSASLFGRQGSVKLIHPGQSVEFLEEPVELPMRLILLVSSTCPACVEDREFYAALAALTEQDAATTFTVLATEPEESIRPWLESAAIQSDRLVLFSEAEALALGFFATPTILLLNQQQSITDLIVGRLSEEDEQVLIRRLKDPTGTAPVNNANLLPEIDRTEYKSLTGSRQMVLFDIRDRGSFSARHRSDAVNIPMDEFGRAELELSKTTAVVVDCTEAPRARCHAAARQLRTWGFSDLFVLI